MANSGTLPRVFSGKVFLRFYFILIFVYNGDLSRNAENTSVGKLQTQQRNNGGSRPWLISSVTLTIVDYARRLTSRAAKHATVRDLVEAASRLSTD